ncbi:transmembrane anterior posterior transformation protein 1 [Entomortierella parvispora]|uniref:Transmembrane anterior posterior transformation protein 1 n=1 Tax=Entomortierella parvispora TaxID=205924 RepID=A0A9P3LSS3_9FUNG|nr:transmembrane anterior posterior transformation protein 1 [Entomortierella parvispora]
MSTQPSPSRQTGGPAKKHGKKKSRTSWKAGFNSTPSSPAQNILEGRLPVLTDISNLRSAFASDLGTSTKQIPEHTQQKDSRTECSPLKDDCPQSVENGEKPYQRINSERLQPKDRRNTHKNEFLQTLDNQLTKIRREDDRGKKYLPPDNNDAKLSSRNGSMSKAGGSIKMLEQELSELLKPPASAASVAPSSEGQAVKLDSLKLKTLLGSITSVHQPSSVSLWDYLKEELTAADFESTQELKRERVANFLSVPIAFEKMLVFGYFVCLDSFLYTFTILPARFALALVALFRYLISRTWFSKSKERVRLKSSQKCDLIKVTLVVVACTILQSVDASRTYHFIRGQNAMKLYAIFNCLEIFDRLCCSFGQDILDSLFSKSTLGSHPPKTSHTASRHARPLTFVVLAILYILAHTMVLFFQMVTLNVAVNSYSNALLTLLISNQFVEIKGSVFKKFEKENLFQLSCSDIVERFQLSVFVTIITIRNLVELSAAPPSPFSVYPQSFVPLFSSMTAVARLLTPCILVLGCETLVDWLKHAFITKFNQIRPSVYDRFVDILSRDLVVGSPARIAGRNNQQQMFVDQSPMVSRRIGLAALPLACLVICVTVQTLQMVMATLPEEMAIAPAVTVSALQFEHLANIWQVPPIEFSSGFGAAVSSLLNFALSFSKFAWTAITLNTMTLYCWTLYQAHKIGISQEFWHRLMEYGVIILVCLATYVCLVALKLLIGINLLGFAHHRFMTMESREQAERKTDRMARESSASLEEKAADAAVTSMLDGRQSGQANSDLFHAGGEKRVLQGLDTIDRYTLFKSRIP